MVKSEAEIGKIRAACAVADRAFGRVGEVARAAVPLDEVFRRFQMMALDEGADWVPYLAGAAGHGGYADVISPATRRPLARGDVLMLDTGLVRDGYFCDFDRNFSVGPPDRVVADAHRRLIEATHAGFAVARPGAGHGARSLSRHGPDRHRRRGRIGGRAAGPRAGHGADQMAVAERA